MLLDHMGNPVSSADIRKFKKAPQPIKGEAFGQWGGENLRYGNMPGIGIVQFDLSKLTIPDYRAMREHYQVNASLSVLSFMQHQSDWHIECENPKIAEECEQQLREVWTPLNRSMSTANWAGYAPTVLQWENSTMRSRTVLAKVKDLVPENCHVNWKEVDAWTPPGTLSKPKISIYDGIKQLGTPWPVPVDNTFWYALLQEHGNFYGKNLLKPAFTSWYFSILMHLFANRYYERYGEPIVKGRAPFDADVKLPNGQILNGMEYLLTVVQQMRNRSVIALPDDKTEMSNGRMEFDYDVSYVESQMRGSDWERYMTRLDEEISIGLFTPILLLRTADVGSYNLGVGHMQMYLWMLNAMNDDRALYINKYILKRMVDFNFGTNAPRAKIKFRKLGNQNAEVIRTMIDSLMQKGRIRPDIQELGEIAGLNLEEIEEVTTEPEVTQPQQDASPTGVTGEPASDGPPGVDEPRATAQEITARVARQAERVFKRKESTEWVPDLGHTSKLGQALYNSGVSNPPGTIYEMYRNINLWSKDVLESEVFNNSAQFMEHFERVLNNELEKVSS